MTLDWSDFSSVMGLASWRVMLGLGMCFVQKFAGINSLILMLLYRRRQRQTSSTDVMYSLFVWCLGTTANLGPLARSDNWTSVRGNWTCWQPTCYWCHKGCCFVVTPVVDVPVVVVDVAVNEWSDMLCMTVMVCADAPIIFMLQSPKCI